MPRGTALSDVRAMLKAEIGDYSGTNTARDLELNLLLYNKQIQLSHEFDWSFFERRWNAAVAAGQRYVPFPTVDADFGENVTINLDMLETGKVEVLWNQNYYPIMYGIGEDEYNMLNPLLNQSADPIRRWREASNVVEPPDSNKFEVWPVPVSNQIVRFTANRNLLPFEDDADVCDLDDMLLVLGVATEILTRTKQPDAITKGQLFTRRLRQLGMRNPMRDKKRIMGGGTPQGDRRPDIKLVAIH